MTTRPYAARGQESSDMLQETPFASYFVAVRPEVVIWECPSIIAHGSHVEGLDASTIAEINSSDIGGMTMSNGHKFGLIWRLPNEIDVSKELNFGLVISNSETLDAAKTHAWTCTYTKAIPGTTALAAPATAFDTNCGTTTNVGANILQQSSTWGAITAAKMTALSVTAGWDHLMLNFALTLTGAANCTLYKVIARYYRRQIG